MKPETVEQPAATAKPFPWKCSKCKQREMRPARTDYTTEIHHDGRLHTVHVPDLQIIKCSSCGEWTYSDPGEAQLFHALRHLLGLLQPEEIRQSIKALNLTQRELAARLGVAEESVSRWINGAMIQSLAMDRLLRVYFASPEARAVLTDLNRSA